MQKVLVLVGVVAFLGCGGGEGPAVVPLQSGIVGTWTAPLSPPDQSYAGCIYAVTFAADGTYGAGAICTDPESGQVDVEWGGGAFTAAPSGRINFIGSFQTSPCRGPGPVSWPHSGYAEYGGTASRPTITLGPPSQDYVLVPSAVPPFADNATFGCFDDAGAFTPQ